jgi:hypothetical protein
MSGLLAADLFRKLKDDLGQTRLGPMRPDALVGAEESLVAGERLESGCHASSQSPWHSPCNDAAIITRT